jgi:hypothetical protein
MDVNMQKSTPFHVIIDDPYEVATTFPWELHPFKF